MQYDINEVKIIPREVIFGNPVKNLPMISPDGKQMAYIAPVEGVMNVWVKAIDGDDDRPVTHDHKRGVHHYFWGHDNRHILYVQDVDGDENWLLYGVDLLTGEIRNFTPYENVQVRIVKHHKNFPNEILIAINKDDARFHDVYHLDLGSGKIDQIAKNPGNVSAWISDARLKLRACVVARPDDSDELLIREDEHAAWRRIITWDSEDTMNSGPICFSRDGREIYLFDSTGANTSRIVKLTIDTGEKEIIAEDPTYDVSDVMVHPDRHEIQAVAFTRARKEWSVLDETIKADFENIAKLEDGDFTIYNRDNRDNTWLVGFIKDNGPVSFYAYDRTQKKAFFLFDNRPALRDYHLASTEPISFKARDGLVIHGYLTRPASAIQGRQPMILLVHGGPWYRDTWGYDPEVQWLTNRGYICLQVNFRGSTGYGKDFVNAAIKEFGGRMHDDLVDAVHWAVEKGIADPARIAIYGASYGGYAALVGAAFTPDLFACAVDIVGPSNLITLIRSIPAYWTVERTRFLKRVGDPDAEADFLKSRSPLFKVDQIKIPILIAQGANDPRCKKAEADQIVEAMKERGLDYEYLLFPDEGHGFVKPENRLRFYAAAEKFLSRHLGGRHEGKTV